MMYATLSTWIWGAGIVLQAALMVVLLVRGVARLLPVFTVLIGFYLARSLGVVRHLRIHFACRYGLTLQRPFAGGYPVPDRRSGGNDETPDAAARGLDACAKWLSGGTRFARGRRRMGCGSAVGHARARIGRSRANGAGGLLCAVLCLGCLAANLRRGTAGGGRICPIQCGQSCIAGGALSRNRYAGCRHVYGLVVCTGFALSRCARVLDIADAA